MAAWGQKYYQTVIFERATSETNSGEKGEVEFVTKRVVVCILLHTWSTQNMLKAEPCTAFSLGFYPLYMIEGQEWQS